MAEQETLRVHIPLSLYDLCFLAGEAWPEQAKRAI
jgi:hypothetical protein